VIVILLKCNAENAVERTIHLEQENERLNSDLYEIQSYVEELRNRCKKHEKKNLLLAQVRSLKKENQDMKEDTNVLKSVVRRLNTEISRYQEKVGMRSEFYTPSRINQQCTTSNSSPTNSQTSESYRLLEMPRKMQPLLQAYDELIQDKNEIIADHERKLDKFKVCCKSIVQENEELHGMVAERSQKVTSAQKLAVVGMILHHKIQDFLLICCSILGIGFTC
jgi:hypothetical protein